jgi:hypothetical protein
MLINEEFVICVVVTVVVVNPGTVVFVVKVAVVDPGTGVPVVEFVVVNGGSVVVFSYSVDISVVSSTCL